MNTQKQVKIWMIMKGKTNKQIFNQNDWLDVIDYEEVAIFGAKLL